MKTKAVSTRRRFFWQAGALLSAPLAVSAAPAPERNADDGEALQERVATLEDVNAVRALQQTYARLVNAREHEQLVALFADPAAAKIDETVSSISADAFGADDVIEIASDHASAIARIHCVVQVATDIGPSCTLVEMARQQGEGVIKRSERRVLESAYVKEGGAWKITHAVYRLQRA